MQPNQGFITEEPVTQLPQTQVPDIDLEEEKKLAKFSKTAEFKRMKAYAEERIKFYQSQLPDGRNLTDVDTNERAQLWVVSNAVIGEFKALLDRYEMAAEVVREHSQR